MDEISTNLDRRTFFIAGGVAAAVAAGLPARADTPKSDAAKANVKVVTDFINSWTGGNADKLADYLADNCSVLMEEGKPTVNGPAAVVAAFKDFMKDGTKLTVKVSSITEKGPVVITQRVDTITNPGKPAQPFPVVGVFVVRNGKITYWSDYLAT